MQRGAYSRVVVLVLIFAVFAVLVLRDPINDGINSAITGMASSQVSNLSATVATYVSCSWSNAALNVGFGTTLNPNVNNYNGTNNYNATIGNGSTTNGTMYNATVDTISNVNVDLTINGSNLVNGGNTLGIGNVTWVSNYTAFINASNTSQMHPDNSTAISGGAQDSTNKVAVNIAPGSTAHFRFYLDIPSGQVAAAYTGNYTMVCTQV